MDFKSKLRHVMNFPKEGIDFIDITTILGDGEMFKESIEQMIKKVSLLGDADIIMGPESRGFIFAAPIAYAMGKSFVPVRKKGKLPYKTISAEYQLEYGCDIIEIHEDAIQPGKRVVIVDDLLATGGTTMASIELVKRSGGIVLGAAYFIELGFLNARKNLNGYNVESVVVF